VGRQQDPGMSRDLYLHEYIDIVGLGAWPYMEHVKTARGDEIITFQLLGTWYTIGCTGRWSQVVNIWEVPNGWDGWGVIVDRLNLKRKDNTDLEGWWNEALKHRTGGYDRIMGAGPGNMSIADIQRKGIKAALFVHELSTVRPGAGLDYLRAVQEEWAPVAAEHGHQLVGSYEVLLHDTEVVNVWATSVEAHVELGKSYDAARGFAHKGIQGDDRIVKWRSRAREFTTRWREELLTPCPGTLMGPSEYEIDTDLDKRRATPKAAVPAAAAPKAAPRRKAPARRTATR
jgi:hypothetical protein